MRIGLIAPPWIPVPPPAYGGTEEVIDNLARGLAALGQDVLLFTVGESTCGCRSGYSGPRPSRWVITSGSQHTSWWPTRRWLTPTSSANHTDLDPVLAGRRGIARQPVVITIHGQVTAQNRRRLAQAARHASVVAISHAHARSFGPIPVAAIIHHGIDLDLHKLGPGTGGYLLFVGRMSPDEGVHRGTDRPAGRWPLVISARIGEPAEDAYFEKQVRPLFGPDDDMLAEQPLAARIGLMGHAAALLNPITWPSRSAW